MAEEVAVPYSYTSPAPYDNAPAYGAMKTMSKNSSGMKMADSNKLAQAFSDTSAKNDSGVWLNAWHYDKGLEFHTLYHPFSGQHTRRLDQYGMEGLMESDITASDPFLRNDNGSILDDTYDPDWDYVVPKHSKLGKCTLCQENSLLRVSFFEVFI